LCAFRQNVERVANRRIRFDNAPTRAREWRRGERTRRQARCDHAGRLRRAAADPYETSIDA
jgi:hypothetical protein